MWRPLRPEERAEAAAKPPLPDLSGQPVTREGDTLTIGSGEPTHEIDITVSDEEYAAIRGAIPERTAYDRLPQFTTWAIPSIWMTAPIKLPNCGRIRCSCCPPA